MCTGSQTYYAQLPTIEGEKREETRFYIICRSAKTRYTAGIRLLKGLFEKTSCAIMSAYSVNVWPLETYVR